MKKKISEKCTINSVFFNVCEFIESMFLVIAAVTPIILFVNIFEAPIWIAVTADTLSVGFILFALIEIFGPICTAYFNQTFSITFAIDRRISWIQAFH